MDGVNAIAVLVSVIALLAAVANGGYLALLRSAATKRAGSGEVTAWVKGHTPPAAGAGIAALLALLMTSGGTFGDLLAVIVAVAGGAVATRSLQSTRTKFAVT